MIAVQSLSSAHRSLADAISLAFENSEANLSECSTVLDELPVIAASLALLGPTLSAEAMRNCLARLAAANLLGGTVDSPPSRLRLSHVGRHLCLEHISRRSNELAFLCQQHLGALALVNAERRQLGTDGLLAEYASGRRTLGIAASHLRQAGADPIVAKPEGKRVRMTGSAPWVSGYGIFDDVLVGARTPIGGTSFFILPFEEAEGMSIRRLPDLWAMASTRTVCLDVDRQLEANELVSTDAGGRFSQTHGGQLFQPICHTLGLIYRALQHIAAMEPVLDADLACRIEALVELVGGVRRRFYELLAIFAGGAPTAGHLDEMLWLRASLAQRSLQIVGALLALTGGKSLLSRFQLTSLLEEAIFFSTTTVNPQMKSAMASCLLGPERAVVYGKVSVA